MLKYVIAGFVLGLGVSVASAGGRPRVTQDDSAVVSSVQGNFDLVDAGQLRVANNASVDKQLIVGGVVSGVVIDAGYAQLGNIDAGTSIIANVVTPTGGKHCLNLACTSSVSDSAGSLSLVPLSGTTVNNGHLGLATNYYFRTTTSATEISFYNIGSGSARFYTDSTDNASQAAWQYGGSVSFAGTSPYMIVDNNATRIFTLRGDGTITTPGLEAHTVQAVVGTDTGDGSPRAITLTPTSSEITVDCQDADTCDVTMSETGATSGSRICITVIGATGAVDFADSAGVSELAGAFAAGAADTICLVYVNSAWHEISRSNN